MKSSMKINATIKTQDGFNKTMSLRKFKQILVYKNIKYRLDYHTGIIFPNLKHTLVHAYYVEC